MEQVKLLLPTMEDDSNQFTSSMLSQLESLEFSCLQLKDLFELSLAVSYSGAASSSGSIVSYVSSMHDHINQLVSLLARFQGCLEQLVAVPAQGEDTVMVLEPMSPEPATRPNKPTESPMRDNTSVYARLEQLVLDALCPCLQHAPVLFELTVHDFSLLFVHLVDVIAQLKRLPLEHVLKSLQALQSSLLSWQTACLEGLFGTTNMVFALHCLHTDWSSHSMYQRNKRFSPGLVAYLSNAKGLLYALTEHSKARHALTSSRDHVEQTLPVLLFATNKVFSDVVRLYLCDLHPSRVRLWQFKADMVYALLNLLGMLQCIKQYVQCIGPDLLDAMAPKLLDMQCARLCEQMHRTLSLLIWHLHILFDTNAVDMIAYLQSVLSEGSPAPCKAGCNDLGRFLLDMEDLLNSHTSLFSAYEAYLAPIRGATAALESATITGDKRYNYSADVICMLGLLPDCHVDHSKSSEGNGYTGLQGKLIDIVNAFTCSNPLATAGYTVSDLVAHAQSMADTILSSAAGGEEEPGTSPVTLEDIKLHAKKTLQKRHDVQDCEYPALTEQQIISYKLFQGFIKDNLQRPQSARAVSNLSAATAKTTPPSSS